MKEPARNKGRAAKRHNKIDVKSKYGIKITHHRHTGRRVPVHCTSYALLFFVLVLAGATLLLASYSVKAADGVINLSGFVPGPAPNVPADIHEPQHNQRFKEYLISVSGTCQTNKILEVYRQGVFAGSTICSENGNFQINIALFPGKNSLMVRTRDSLGRYGPDSGMITVYYDAPSTKSPLVLYTEPLHTGTQAGNEFNLKYEIAGGAPAYAVSIDWDDNLDIDLVSLPKPGDYYKTHVYERLGLYHAVISASDQAGNKAMIKTLIAINGSKDSSGIGSSIPDACIKNPRSYECFVASRIVNMVDKLWPAFSFACLMTFSFWLGERVVYTRMRPRPQH